MWEYFFALENGYSIVQYTDDRLHAATELFNALLQEKWNDIKLKNFVHEMTAYIDLLENKKSLALNKYQQLIANASEVFSVTYNRSNEMLKRMSK